MCQHYVYLFQQSFGDQQTDEDQGKIFAEVDEDQMQHPGEVAGHVTREESNPCYSFTTQDWKWNQRESCCSGNINL